MYARNNIFEYILSVVKLAKYVQFILQTISKAFKARQLESNIASSNSSGRSTGLRKPIRYKLPDVPPAWIEQQRV